MLIKLEYANNLICKYISIYVSFLKSISELINPMFEYNVLGITQKCNY